MLELPKPEPVQMDKEEIAHTFERSVTLAGADGSTTPKEIADGQARGAKGGAELGALAAAAGGGALLERVRATMTPGQLKALQAGGAPRGLGVEAMGAPGAGVEVAQDGEDQAPDPFGD